MNSVYSSEFHTAAANRLLEAAAGMSDWHVCASSQSAGSLMPALHGLGRRDDEGSELQLEGSSFLCACHLLGKYHDL